MEATTFVGLDVHKRMTSVALAEAGRRGEVRFVGEIPSTPEALHRLVERLQDRHRRLSLCYEAGPCGYGVHRLLSGLGQECSVVAPSLIPSRPGDRVKTNRRDASTLARLHRAGELTPVWVPDAAREAMRDLVRARATARRVLGKARQHLQGFLLRHGRIYCGVRGWTRVNRRWLTTVRFDHPAQQIVLQDYIHAVEDAEARLERLEHQIEELLPGWSMAPVVEAVQAMRGVGLIVAITVVAEVGDFSRFANPRQRIAYLGLVPSEHSSGSSIRRGGITKAGPMVQRWAHARRVLIEGAWTYRMQAPGSAASCSTGLNICPRRSAISPGGRSCACATATAAWPAAGKPKVVVTTAIAREMVGFIWAIARIVRKRCFGRTCPRAA